MKKLLTISTGLLLLCFGTSTAKAGVELFDWGINLDGTTYCLEGPCDFDVFASNTLAGDLSGLPSAIDHSSFPLSNDTNTLNGLGTLTITVSNTSGVTENHFVGVYFNYDIDYDVNWAVNETGFSVGAPASGQSWEIDEIGWGSGQPGTGGTDYVGDVYINFQSAPGTQFDNKAFWDDTNSPGQFSASMKDDTALAMSWDFSLSASETATITFNASDTVVPSGFYLAQRDPDSNVNVYLSSAISKVGGGSSVPVPGTLLLLGTGLVGLIGGRLRRHKKE